MSIYNDDVQCHSPYRSSHSISSYIQSSLWHFSSYFVLIYEKERSDDVQHWQDNYSYYSIECIYVSYKKIYTRYIYLLIEWLSMEQGCLSAWNLIKNRYIYIYIVFLSLLILSNEISFATYIYIHINDNRHCHHVMQKRIYIRKNMPSLGRWKIIQIPRDKNADVGLLN